MFSRKGQGSLEYLLLIGGAVLVAAIVIALVISSGTSGGGETKLRTAAGLCYGRIAQVTEPTVTVQTSIYYCCNQAAMTVGVGTYTGAATTNPPDGVSGTVAPFITCAEYVA